MSRCLRTLLVALFGLLALGPSPLRATTMVYLSSLDLLKASDTVVVGEVTAVRYEERNGAIVTIVTLKIAETWKAQGPGQSGGPVTGASIEIVESGGVIGDHAARTGGVPQYKQGDRVVSFLQVDPTAPEGAAKTYRTTGGVPGRHLIVPSDAQPKPAGAPAPPPDILARPVSDADCDYAGHDAQGHTVLVDFGQMLRIEAAQKTTLDQFRAEVTGYQKALAVGENPALSPRDEAIKSALQTLFDRGGRPNPPPAAGPALPAPGDLAPTTSPAPPRDLGPFVVLREEDIDRLIREKRAQQQAADQARDASTRTAWIVFAVSGCLFVGLTLFLRRRKVTQSAPPA